MILPAKKHVLTRAGTRVVSPVQVPARKHVMLPVEVPATLARVVIPVTALVPTHAAVIPPARKLVRRARALALNVLNDFFFSFLVHVLSKFNTLYFTQVLRRNTYHDCFDSETSL